MFVYTNTLRSWLLLIEAVVGHVTDFVSELEAIRRQVADIDGATSTSSPVVVHCSAGVGRTGVVILVAVMKASLEHNQVCVSVIL